MTPAQSAGTESATGIGVVTGDVVARGGVGVGTAGEATGTVVPTGGDEGGIVEGAVLVLVNGGSTLRVPKGNETLSRLEFPYGLKAKWAYSPLTAPTCAESHAVVVHASKATGPYGGPRATTLRVMFHSSPW